MGEAGSQARTTDDHEKSPQVRPAQQPDHLQIPKDEAGTGGLETDLWVGRMHWKHFMGRLLAWVAGMIVAGVITVAIARRTSAWSDGTSFWIILALVAVSGLPVFGGIFIRVFSTRYRLTTQRLFIERGILSQTVDQTELVRVDDVRVHKPFLDRLFGVGSVGVVSTDATDREIAVEGIAGPDRVAELIRTRMRTLRQKSVYLENL